MAAPVSNWVAVLVVFSALLTGAMGETLDSDLIGVVVAAVCVAILCIVFIGFCAYCCLKRVDSDRKSDRNSLTARKDSRAGSMSTTVTPRWNPAMTPMMPATMPVYSVPAEPVMYALPQPYYLGYYAPKFIDSERLEMVYRQEMLEDRQSFRRSSERERDEKEEEKRQQRHQQQQQQQPQQEEEEVQEQTATTVLVETASPPNGEAVQEAFSSSSVNYKVIRKQHKNEHEKMPEWLRKSYGENEQSLDLGDEDDRSRASSVRSNRLLVLDTPELAVRAIVSPDHIADSASQVLTTDHDYTIVDFIDPEQSRAPPATATATTTTTTTRIITTTTTIGEGKEDDKAPITFHGVEGGTNVFHASTFSPGDQGDEEAGREMGLENHRMRKADDGAVSFLPEPTLF